MGFSGSKEEAPSRSKELPQLPARFTLPTGGMKEVSSATARVSGPDWSVTVPPAATSAKRPLPGQVNASRSRLASGTNATATAAMQPMAATTTTPNAEA